MRSRRKVRVLVEGVPPTQTTGPSGTSSGSGGRCPWWRPTRKSVGCSTPGVPPRPVAAVREHRGVQSRGLREPVLAVAAPDHLRLREGYQVDAVVIHGIKSCRSFTAGQGDLRDWLIHDQGVPTLYIESDHQDPRYFAAAQIKTRMDAFFESLEQRRAVAAAASSGGR